MQAPTKEWEEKKAVYERRFRLLSGRSGDSRKAAAEKENRSKTCRQMKKEEANGCSSDPAMLECFLPVGGAQAKQQLADVQAEVSRVCGGQQYRPEPIAPERGAGAEP